MISVIVLNYNGKEHIATCLSSLVNQTLSKTEFEIIVVDNHSTDGSAEYVAKNYPAIRLLELSKNQGFSIANNKGVEKAVGEWIVFLNNDTEVAPDWLAKLKAAQLKNKESVSFASKMLFFDRRDIIDTAGDMFSLYGFGFKRGYGEKDNGQYDSKQGIFGPCGGAGMYRKDVFKALGGFDEDFFAYCEDVDLNYRIKLYGYKTAFVPEAVVYHKLGGTFKGWRDKAIFLSQRNQEYVLFKNGTFRELYNHWFYNVYSALKHLFKGKLLVFLRAKFEALKNLKRMLAKRRWIYAKKKYAVKKDELDHLVVKFEKEAYHLFFAGIKEGQKENTLKLIERKNLKAGLDKRLQGVLERLFIEDSEDLVFLGRYFYLYEDKRCLELFLKEFSRYLAEFKTDKDLLNILISYGYFKNAGIKQDVKKKLLLLVADYVNNRLSASVTVAERTVLHAVSEFIPFIYKAPEEDVLNWLAQRISPEGISTDGAKKPKENLELVEALAVNMALARLKKTMDVTNYAYATDGLFEFVFKLCQPDKTYDRSFAAASGRVPDLEYVKYLRALFHEDWDSAVDSPYVLEYIFFGGEFSPEEKDLKPAPFSPDLSSAGFSKNKFYIMRNEDAILKTSIFSFSFVKDGEEILLNTPLPTGKYFSFDDGLIAYDKNLETNLWVAGKEYDFLDADYDATPSVRHRIQYFLHKKTSCLVIRHKFSGAEQHTVKISFFTREKAVNAPLVGIDKQFVRDAINKFGKANKTETAFLKLNGEESVGASLYGGKNAILPLLNPTGLKVEINNDCITYTANLLLPNELIFLVY